MPSNRHITESGTSERVTMIGLDFGSTTSSAMVATADVGMSLITGRMAFGAPRILYRSEPVFTPFVEEQIDSVRLGAHVDRWIAESGVRCHTLFAGGVIITGLAAKRANAANLARLVGDRIGEAVVATADDPCLESWLAFMGSCSLLSRLHAETPFINIDIGGGTTNPAYGINGCVLRTGCHFVGARHFQFEPGTYRLVGVSAYGRALLASLGIERDIGDLLVPEQMEAILDFYITALEAIAAGDTGFFASPIARLHQQVPFSFDAYAVSPVVVFSGGVGELIYRGSRGESLPGTTHYGDLGIDLARRILDSPLLAARVNDRIPENGGRATVYGLTLHSTEISGSTLFLPAGHVLPLRDLPIVARLSIHAGAETVHQAISLVHASAKGACIQVLSDRAENAPAGDTTQLPVRESLDAVKRFARHLHEACMQAGLRVPVVVLVPHNYGQALGNYASNWRTAAYDLIVIDEIPDRHAHFVNIGRLFNQMVPVSFYGVC